MDYITFFSRSESDKKKSLKPIDQCTLKTYPNSQVVEERIIHDLSPSILLLSFLGILSLGENSRKASPFSRFVCGIIEYVIHALWLYVLIISTLSTIRVARQLQTSFTLSQMNVLIAIIRFVFYSKRHKVYSTIRSIARFYCCVTDNQYKAMRNTLTALCCAGLVASIVMGVISNEHLRAAGTLQTYARDFVFGYNLTEGHSDYCRIFPVCIFTACIFYQHFTPVSLCIFICSVFIAFKKSVDMFAAKLKNDSQRGTVKVEDYARLYRQMVQVLSDVEDLLSACTFFLYGCLLTNQLCVVTQFIAGRDQTSVLHLVSLTKEFLLSFKNVIIFFSITLLGASVSQAMDSVRTEIKFLAVGTSQDFEKLSLLLHNVCSTPSTLTAWRMFNLKRGLILTTGSVMISYAMLLLQFSQNKTQ